MPRVAVVSGYYNRADRLERTVTSILGQTFEDFELVVFDDRSTDDTVAQLQRLERELDDARFRWYVHDENKGFVTGLREAIATTDSEYIAIQGSGDVSAPHRLAEQVAYLDAHPDVAVVGGWYWNVQEGQGTRRLRQPNADGIGLDDLIRENYFSHGEVMIRRSVYDEVGGYRTIFRYTQDRDLWLRIARSGGGFGTVPSPIYDRYVQFDGVSYVPEKIVDQACFSIAAQRMVRMDQRQEADAVERMKQAGVRAVVGPEDPVVQGKLVRAALRMIVFGAPKGGQQLTRTYVNRGVKKAALNGLATLYRSPLRHVVKPVIQRVVGMRAGA